jgi:hypothetical protein
VLCFLETAGNAYSRGVVDGFLRHRDRFDDDNASFFGVSGDSDDELRLRQVLPGYRYFWDFRLGLSKLYGVYSPGNRYRRCTHVLDPRLRVLAAVPFEPYASP